MELPNRHGRSVDAVPFFVVASLAFLFTFAFGPLYGTMFGFSIAAGTVGSAVVFVACTCGAYYRLVWTVNPDVRAEVPASVRIRNIFYATVAFFLLLVMLLLPVVYRILY